MEAEFWHKKWQTGDIGFHTASANPLLVAHFGALKLAPGQTIFVPLCGKTLDIHWLLAQGLHVKGIDLSEIAIRELFAELGLNPVVQQQGELLHYQAAQIDIYVGDIFALQAEQLGQVDAIYDRAALVALPATLRQRYVQHLPALTTHQTKPQTKQHSKPAQQLLICHEYDQEIMAGPPFAITTDLVTALYQDSYHLHLLNRVEIAGGFKGKIPATEAVWHLQAG